MNRCIAQPLSYLVLERRRLNELSVADRRAVDDHLDVCHTCRAYYAQTAEVIELLPLPQVLPRSPQVRAAPRFGFAFAGLAVAAAALLVLVVHAPSPVGPGLEPPASRMHVRGGDLALGLVRMGSRGELLAPTHFAVGDRFKAQITCPPTQLGSVQIVVYQRGRAFFPVAPLPLERCGNQLSVPGAFAFDGQDPALVCAVFDDGGTLDRRSLTDQKSLPKHSVCEQVLPAGVQTSP
ncbi:MAG TPA: hypothetical protein VF331_00580 [Polyangiales bacterium]